MKQCSPRVSRNKIVLACIFRSMLWNSALSCYTMEYPTYNIRSVCVFSVCLVFWDDVIKFQLYRSCVVCHGGRRKPNIYLSVRVGSRYTSMIRALWPSSLWVTGVQKSDLVIIFFQFFSSEWDAMLDSVEYIIGGLNCVPFDDTKTIVNIYRFHSLGGTEVVWWPSHLLLFLNTVIVDKIAVT